MKKVLKNIAKSIGVTCLILEIVSIIYGGIYMIVCNKLYEKNDEEFVKGIIQKGEFYREEFSNKNDEEGNKQLGLLVTSVPVWVRLETTAMLLMFSILIGSAIGIAMSVEKQSKKKTVIMYLVTYGVVVLVIILPRIIIR